MSKLKKCFNIRVNKLKKWCNKHYGIWIMIAILELSFILYCFSDRVRNVMLKMVLDSNGNFNWAVVTAITAIFAIIFAWINNNKNIKANLVSKSRIEWIQEVRKVSVEFLNSCYNVTAFISTIKVGKSETIKPKANAIAAASITLFEEKGKNADAFGEDKKYFIEEQSKVKKIGQLLTLYLGPDSSNNNEFIVFLIDTIILSISNNSKIFEQKMAFVNDVIEDLKNVLRVYFKNEWNRSIGQIDEDNVDNELDKNLIYKCIKDKYKVLFENRNDEKNIEYELINNRYVIKNHCK